VRFLRWFFLGGVPAAVLAPLACEGTGPIELIVRPGNEDDGGSSHDAAQPDTSTDGSGGDPDAGDAGASPVLLGLRPNAKGDGVPSSSDVIGARLQVLAAGARGVVVRRAPAEIDDEAEIAALAKEAKFYSDRGSVVAFSLGVVDRFSRRLPSDVEALPWDAPEVTASVRLAIDRAFTAFAGCAPYFLVGRDVDVFLASHPEERAGFEAFALDVIDYVHTHPLAAPETRVGVGFSFEGVSLGDPSFVELLESSDVAVVSYFPGLGLPEVGLSSAITTDLPAMVASASGKGIVLEAIGYPSSSVVGASEEKQAHFLDAFFEALGPRRSGFPFVNVEALHDMGPMTCADLASKAGQPADGPYAAYACSLGLRTVTGQEKAGWQAFLKGAAAFASP